MKPADRAISLRQRRSNGSSSRVWDTGAPPRAGTVSSPPSGRWPTGDWGFSCFVDLNHLANGAEKHVAPNAAVEFGVLEDADDSSQRSLEELFDGVERQPRLPLDALIDQAK
jgi:hypothetical protein